MFGIVIVNYRNENEICHFLQSEVPKLNVETKIVVVDNSADEVFEDKLQIKIDKLSFSNVDVLNEHINYGFAKANNIGFKYLYDNFNISYVLFTNTDITIKKINLKKTLNFIALNNIALYGPKVIGIDGKDQSPCRYISFYNRYILGKFLYPIVHLFRIKNRISDVIEDAKSGYYYRLIGCFCIMNSEIFVKAGLFDPKTFLYSEEKILAERLLKIGYKSYYDNQAIIIHSESSTIRDTYSEKGKWSKILESDVYYYSEYLGQSNFFIRNIGKLSLFLYFNIYILIIRLLKKE